MDKVVIVFNGKDVEIPKSDLDWFLNEKGAKLKEEKTTTPKIKSKNKNNNNKK